MSTATVTRLSEGALVICNGHFQIEVGRAGRTWAWKVRVLGLLASPHWSTNQHKPVIAEGRVKLERGQTPRRSKALAEANAMLFQWAGHALQRVDEGRPREWPLC